MLATEKRIAAALTHFGQLSFCFFRVKAHALPSFQLRWVQAMMVLAPTFGLLCGGSFRGAEWTGANRLAGLAECGAYVGVRRLSAEQQQNKRGVAGVATEFSALAFG
jgi:hypothetical protein